MRKHGKFILTPVTSLLDDAVNAVSCVEPGIASFPLRDYFMQSLFLKMTGFQEQKMKCISWELATDDFELRRKRYYSNAGIGECSSYKDKNTVYTDIVDELKRISATNPLDDVDRETIINDTKKILADFYNQPIIKSWTQKSYFDFDSLYDIDPLNPVMDNKCIRININDREFKFFASCNSCTKRKEVKGKKYCRIGSLKDVYEKMYRHRNRCAHNLKSYQNNLPTIETLDKQDFILENYYLYFAVLIIIDKIVTLLFKKYLEKMDFSL